MLKSNFSNADRMTMELMSDTEMIAQLDAEIADSERSLRRMQIEAITVGIITPIAGLVGLAALGLALWFHSMGWGLTAAAAAAVTVAGSMLYRMRHDMQLFVRRAKLARLREDRADFDQADE